MRSIEKLISTVLVEMDSYVCPSSYLQIPGGTNGLKGEKCGQLWPLTATALQSQSTHTGQQVQPLTTQLSLLTNELLFQRRIYQLQPLLLIQIIIAVAVSVCILSCNRKSTSSNSFSPGGVGGGREFLSRHLRSTAQNDDPQSSPPPDDDEVAITTQRGFTNSSALSWYFSSPIYRNIPRINYGR